MMAVLVSMGFILISPSLTATKKQEAPEIVLPSDEVLRDVPQVLRDATTSDPKTLNLPMAQETSSTDILGPLFESLVRLHPITLTYEDKKYCGVLATDWEVDETGKIWIFHLREGVKWSDGEDFTADDVVFTLKVNYDPDIHSSMMDILTFKDGKQITCEKIDDYTVKFVTPEPFAPFLHHIGGMAILPEHILDKPWREKDEKLSPGERFCQMWTINTPVEKIVGTGPYVIAEYVQAQHIIFKRNPYYWRKDEKGRQLPYIEEIHTYIVESQETISLKFKGKKIDIYGPRPIDIPGLMDIAELKGRAAEKKNEERKDAVDKKKKDIILQEVGLSTGTAFIALNQNSKHKNKAVVRWFSNPKFRKAIAYSIDYETIITNVLYGLGLPSSTVISPEVHTFHHDGLENYKYDLDEAKRLLDEAGYKDWDGDGIREEKVITPDGKTKYIDIEFNLTTNSGNTTRESICNILLADWTEKLGFKVYYQPLEFNTLVKKLTENYDWDVVVIGLTGGVEPHSGANVYRSSGGLHLWNPKQATPTTDWEKEVDRLVEQGAKELDLEKRIKIYKRLQEIFYEQLPYIMLPAQEVYVAYYKKLKNYHRYVFGIYYPNYQYIDTAEE